MAKNDKNKNCPPCKKTSIGGQALMEGIMMRGPEKTSMAVRNAKGEIILETSKTIPMTAKVYKIPFVRGIFNMAASLVQGYKCLMRSADIALADADEEDKARLAEKKAKKAAKNQAKADAIATPEIEEPLPEESETHETPVVTDETAVITDEIPVVSEEEPPTNNTVETPAATVAEEPKKSGVATTVVMILGVVLGVALAIGLFIALPTFLYSLLDKYTPIGSIENPYCQSLLKTTFEGVFKIIILVLYMLAVSQMKDIRRVFMYHGAEHKTIFCYEAGLPLTVENVRIQKRFHPRCGTSFLILVLLVSMILGFFIPESFLPWQRVLIKIALLPVTIGFGYELIKLAGRKDNLFTRITSAPGVWLQHITTVEPDDSMIECAIAAMNEVIPEDRNADNW